jgi:hypothetical protein
MNLSEFVQLLQDMKEYGVDKELELMVTYHSFPDKVLLFFIWMVQYQQLISLSVLFGISRSRTGAYLQQALPIFLGFFTRFIPGSFPSDATTSHLSDHIIGVIDGTVHKIRKPCHDQWLWWNGNYQMHTISSLFLVSFDGDIIAVATGIPGSFHDSCAANHIDYFEDACGAKFVIGDPGFAAVPYIVSGLKSNQVR